MKFDFQAAQRFELKYHYGYVKTVFEQEYADWERRKAVSDCGLSPNEFFNGDTKLFARFLDWMKDKNALDIGGGSVPGIKEFWRVKDRYLIDPLAQEYKNIEEELFGKSFYDGIAIYPICAEEFMSILEAKISGVIICRNTLDHTEDPLAILENISRYADRGCYLMLWSDIWHFPSPDTMHRQITQSKTVMEKILWGLDFVKIAPASRVRSTDDYIEYGGLFRKA